MSDSPIPSEVPSQHELDGATPATTSLRHSLARLTLGALAALSGAALDVLQTVLVLTRLPMGIAVSGLLMTYMFTEMTDSAIVTLQSTARNMCTVPIVSHLSICSNAVLAPETRVPSPLADFDTLMGLQNRALDELSGQSLAGSKLALNLRHAEVSVKDLIVAVRASNMTSKTDLADALTKFVADSRLSGRALQQVSARVNGLVDSIDAFNAFARRSLGEGQGNRRELALSAVGAYEAALHRFSNQIADIVVAATHAASGLEALEERLAVVQDLCLKESFSASSAYIALQWDLAAFVQGTYQDKKQDVQYRTVVVQNIDRYRSLAAAYVSATTQSLMIIDIDLSELRGRLLNRNTDPYPGIPVEVDLAGIERSLNRIKEELLRGGQVTSPPTGPSVISSLLPKAPSL